MAEPKTDVAKTKGLNHYKSRCQGLALANGNLKKANEANKKRVKELEERIDLGLKSPDMPDLKPYYAKIDWLDNVIKNNVVQVDDETKKQWSREVNDIRTLFDLLGAQDE